MARLLPFLTELDCEAIDAALLTIEARLVRCDHLPKTEATLIDLQHLIGMERQRAMHDRARNS